MMNDKRMGMRLKAKVYRLVVRPVLTYGAECWAINKRDEKRLEVTDEHAEKDAWGDKEGQTEERRGQGENRNAGKYCESSGEIKDEVVWACGEEGREGCGEKSNGLPSDGEKK